MSWLKRFLPRARFGRAAKWDGTLVWEGRTYRITDPFDCYVAQQPPRLVTDGQP